MVVFNKAYRIIATRYPPIALFERVGDIDAQNALIEAEMLTNPRLREQTGEISIIPPERRVYGEGASYVMAPFAFPKPSRFSDGSYGVYYAANDFETALHETTYHFARHAQDSQDGYRKEDHLVLLGKINQTFFDLHNMQTNEKSLLLSPNSYANSQDFGIKMREENHNGIYYPSVRHKQGKCIAAFWPDTIGIPIQTKKIQYHYDGIRVASYYDYAQDIEIAL